MHTSAVKHDPPRPSGDRCLRLSRSHPPPQALKRRRGSPQEVRYLGRRRLHPIAKHGRFQLFHCEPRRQHRRAQATAEADCDSKRIVIHRAVPCISNANPQRQTFSVDRWASKTGSSERFAPVGARTRTLTFDPQNPGAVLAFFSSDLGPAAITGGEEAPT
jgi:hypothetical protein